MVLSLAPLLKEREIQIRKKFWIVLTIIFSVSFFFNLHKRKLICQNWFDHYKKILVKVGLVTNSWKFDSDFFLNKKWGIPIHLDGYHSTGMPLIMTLTICTPQNSERFFHFWWWCGAKGSNDRTFFSNFLFLFYLQVV